MSVSLEKKEHWALDKRVPIALIVAFVAQTITFIVLGAIWMTRIDGQIENQGARLRVAEQRIIEQEASRNQLLVAVARLEEQAKAQTASLLRIELALTKDTRGN